MQEFDFSIIEAEARKKWADNDVYKVNIDTSKPKYYVLDMFPYPSGAGLHVGHPLGYIASDIFSRYKRLKGFNVLHPMGFDAFGLPAEQYAIQTGQHPAKTTIENIATYKRQLDKIGFSYDWSREVVTSEPEYYRWTQWIFIQLFNSWYDKSAEKARNISELTAIFAQSGNTDLQAACDEKTAEFTAEEWTSFSEKQQQEILMQYRLAYQSYALVNWCPALGTVLANDEIVNGVSERGGHPVERKKMSQWFLRITAYAERLLQGLDTLDWSDSMKEMQRNWIGKSIGAMVSFPLEGHNADVEVFTTRVDTIFGVSFLVIAPEHDLVSQITTPEYAEAVDAYKKVCAAKSDIERQQEKVVSGQFTGAYVTNPLNGAKVPVFIADYVLAGYGTGAVMAVPSGDQRDFSFARKFDLPIIQILDAQKNTEEEADPTKDGKYVNSDFINGMTYSEAVPAVIAELEKLGKGYGKVNFRMRDAGFSRQRYWGEPFPVYYDQDGIVRVLDETELPLTLPTVEDFKPTADGRSPLANAPEWVNALGDGKTRETDTMPAFAGSSWYFLRYMDPKNEEAFVGQEAQAYWQDVDLYIGGTEHAVGHLLYSRFWHKFFKDNNWVSTEEPFKKLVNQGMIQGRSNFIYKAVVINNVTPKDVKSKSHLKHNIHSPIVAISKNVYLKLKKLSNQELSSLTQEEELEYKEILHKISEVESNINEFYKTHDIAHQGTYSVPNFPENYIRTHIDVNVVDNDKININKLLAKKNKLDNYFFITDSEGNIECDWEVEKMSKSKFNVVNPDDMIAQYGADTFRMFEMFLGPIEAHKPWDTNGIEGVSKFVRKVWRLYNFDEAGNPTVKEEASKDELKVLHKAIKKVTDDIERFSFNTAVSALMIAVNDFGKLTPLSRTTLETIPVLMAPLAPFIAEALWTRMGKEGTVFDAAFPLFDEKNLVEDNVLYPVSINGKVRVKLEVSASLNSKEVEELVLGEADVQKWLEGKSPKKVIVVPGRIVNIVL